MRRHRLVLSCILLALLAAPLLAPAASKDKKQPEAAARKIPDAPPADAQWTLYCQAVGGPAHVEQANAMKEALVKLTQRNDWYVIHQEAESVVYCGFYRSIQEPAGEAMKAMDRKTAEQLRKDIQHAQQDRKYVTELADQQGNKVFQHVFFVEITSPDPVAPPEWNLCNADGVWSLEIAAYKDSPKRKEAAVEAVRAARQQGLPAYYYHGETISSVCIGAWPRSAVQQPQDSIEVPASEQEVLVLPQAISGVDQMQFRSRETGERIRTVAPQPKAVDPSLQAMMEKYPTHSVNGMVMISKVKDPKNGQIKNIEDPSFVVPIPHPKPSMLTPINNGPAAPQLINPTGTDVNTGGGKLKSIGDQ